MIMNPAAMSPETRQHWMAARVTHGGYSGGKETPEHYVWRSMLIRCNTNARNYEHVSVCKRWRKYENFLKDMGYRPSPKHTLDRYPDPFGNYERKNCRWTTWVEQSRNKRLTKFYTDGFREGTVGMWAEWLNMSVPLARWRWQQWGTFQQGIKFQVRYNGKKWNAAPAARKKQISPHIKFYTHNGRRGNLTEWAKWLGISPQGAFCRMQNWGTFEKGKVWTCEAQKATRK